MTSAALISDDYRQQIAGLHAGHASWGSTGNRWAGMVKKLMQDLKTADVLDYGCGKSALANALGGGIRQYDPAFPEYSAMPAPADLVLCFDVMEHIEPEHIEAVLDHLQSLVKRCGFFTLSTAQANATLPDGRNAHILIRPARWWLKQFWERFEIKDFKSTSGEVMVLVEPLMETER